MSRRLYTEERRGGRLMGFFGRAVCLALGWGVGYSFSNPEEGSAYEVMPQFKQRRYVHVKKLWLRDFEGASPRPPVEQLKDLHRFFQKQPGYLYTVLLQRDHSTPASEDLPDFVSVSSWLRPEDQTMAENKARSIGLMRGDAPRLYKLLADDQQYSPTQ